MLTGVRCIRPLHIAVRIDKRIFMFSARVFGEPPKKRKLVDVKDNIYTWPNVLCLSRFVKLVPRLTDHFRICMTPVISYLVIQEMHMSACGLFALAGATDMLDGQIARRFPSQRSMFGTMLDPVADKFLISTLFVTLAYVGLIPCKLFSCPTVEALIV